MRVSSLPEVLAKLEMPLPNDAIAELILWAFDCKEEIDVKWQDFPTAGGARVQEWKERSVLFQLVKNSPCDMPYLPPFNHGKHRSIQYSGLANLLSSVDLNATPAIAHHQDCECANCHANVERMQQADKWRNYTNQRINETSKNITPLLQVFIGRLPKKEPSARIHDALKRALPAATNVTVVLDTAQKPKGYAFAEFATDEALQAVLQTKQLCILDKQVVVDVVKGLGLDPSFLPRYLNPLSIKMTFITTRGANTLHSCYCDLRRSEPISSGYKSDGARLVD